VVSFLLDFPPEFYVHSTFPPLEMCPCVYFTCRYGFLMVHLEILLSEPGFQPRTNAVHCNCYASPVGYLSHGIYYFRCEASGCTPTRGSVSENMPPAAPYCVCALKWVSVISAYSKPSILRINEAKDRQKKLLKQINGKFNNIGNADDNKWKKKSLQQFLPL
jgi:hypothetical protein